MCTHYDFRRVPGTQMSQNTFNGSFPVLMRWLNGMLYVPYFKIGDYTGIFYETSM